VVYLEHLGTAVYPDRPADLDYYRHLMNLLTIRAEAPDATPEILGRILAEVRRGKDASEQRRTGHYNWERSMH
jgi:hypothetical protein